MMNIDSVDLFHLSMLAVLVRVCVGGYEGWGRIRSCSAGLDHQPDRAYVTSRVQTGGRMGAGPATGHCGRHRSHQLTRAPQ